MHIKKFEAQDWRIYKAIRLEALALHGHVFGGSLAAESAWSDSQWEYMLGKSDYAFFGLYDGRTLVGSTCVFTSRDDKTGRTALLAGSYIRENYRGRRLSRLLYAARIDWIIASNKYERILVGHREDNEASRRANQRFGFVRIGQEEKQWGDGSVGVLHNYEMRLK